LLRRALDLRAALKLGVQITLGEVGADDLCAMLVLDEEQVKWEREKRP
jgi:hypothetical protein